MTIHGVDPQQQEIQDRTGRWHSLRIRPYKGLDNRLDGAVITLIDIDVARRYQRQVERSRDYFMRIVETVRQPLLVLDDDGRVRTANASFYETFKLSRERTEGVSIYELDNAEWDVPQVRAALTAAAAGETVQSFPIMRNVPSLGSKQLTVNARGFELDDAKHLILVAVEVQRAEEAP
jgi:two-component system CheB/CheR fusion protein